MTIRDGRLQEDYDIAEICKHQKVSEDVLAARVSSEELIRFRAIVSRA